MNSLKKIPLQNISKGFIPDPKRYEFEDEYHFRNQQNPQSRDYRPLTAREIEILVRNNNTVDDWNNIRVSEVFNPQLIRNCQFYGLVRIGNLDACALDHHDLRMPVGLYRSTIINCDIGDDVVINNVRYMSHYIIGNEVMLVNINELVTTPRAKFGLGMLKEDEHEDKRIYIEICNENGGRRILPFDDILPGDAYLWSRNRDDDTLQKRFSDFAHHKWDHRPGYYGKIGDQSVVKNTLAIKDVNMGPGMYIKGANKIKNLTIHSTLDSPSQIGEGCELVNGIIGPGCRIFYGVKAVRFIMASHSQLKYGARLINSFLGNNSTISCCEVLNSLIFPGHEQHHNNSFLCASLVKGQSNMAAGATIGSNHNSRAADGELIAGRGFWPGLSVSLKHNSRFASFVLITKGNYPAELNIPVPFSLVANDEAKDQLIIMPAYWFMHNMYALARNCSKAVKRDQRKLRQQMLHFDYLEPDTVYEIMVAIRMFEIWVGESYLAQNHSEKEARIAGREILSNREEAEAIGEIYVSGIERSDRKVVIRKIDQAYTIFRRLITYHAGNMIRMYLSINDDHSIEDLCDRNLNDEQYLHWENIGGQLIPSLEVENMIHEIKSGTINSWDEVHEFYQKAADLFITHKTYQALFVFEKVNDLSFGTNLDLFMDIMRESVEIKEWLTHEILESRAKDYQNPFRTMVYDSRDEMNRIVGPLDGNEFIKESEEELRNYKTEVSQILHKWKAKEGTPIV